MVNENAQKSFEKGLALLKKKDYNEAIKVFTEAIEQESNFVDAYYYRGLTHFDKGNHYEAFDDLLIAIELDPSLRSKPYDHPLYQGLVHEMRCKTEVALEIYEEIIQNEPKLAIVRSRQGYCYYCLKSYRKAIECYTSAIGLEDDVSTIYYNRAIAYEDLGDEEKSEISKEEYEEYLLKAVEDYTKAIELEPGDSQAINNRGLVYYHLGEYQKAIDDLSATIEENPSLACSYDFRGCAFREQGEFEKALADHTKAINIVVNDPINFYNRALVWIEMGELDNASKDLKTAIKLAPNYNEAKEKLKEIINISE